jgi:hypothetical protein
MINSRRVFKRSQLVAAAIGGLFLASPALADQIDLTVSPYSGAGNQGDLFIRTDQQPTGTGVIKPFLTIQQKGTEHGYNTDSTNTALLLDDHRAPSQWVRSVSFDEITSVMIGGKAYAEFLLDINETNNDGHLLSMDKLELFSTSNPSLTGYTETSFDTGLSTDGFGANATMIYNMDKTVDYTVQLDYSFNHGSGSGDMYAFIPYQLIAANQGQNKYLVMYSSFGHPYSSSAGFEEWSVLTAPSGTPVGGPGVPLPSAALGGAGLMGLLAFKRRRGR